MAGCAGELGGCERAAPLGCSVNRPHPAGAWGLLPRGGMCREEGSVGATRAGTVSDPWTSGLDEDKRKSYLYDH